MNELRGAFAEMPPGERCLSCVDWFGAGLDLLVGLGLLGALIWLLYRLETDPDARVIEHLVGMLVAGFVVFLFVSFSR